jgi:hypothetical protein
MSNYHQPTPTDPYLPLPLDALPITIRDFAVEVAASIGCDPAAVAIPVFASLAGAIGSKRVVRLPDGRHEPATVWAAIIDEGGLASRQAFEAATALVRRKQCEAFSLDEVAIRNHEIALTQYRTLKDSFSSVTRPSKPTGLLAHHRVVSNLSFPALVNRLAASPDGILWLADDLDIVRYAKGEGGVDQLPAMWCGNPLIRDLAKKSIFIERPSLSIVGRMRFESFRRALGHEPGLMAPLLLAMPPTPKNVPRSGASLNSAVESKFTEFFDKLWVIASKDEFDRPAPNELQLSPEAHEAWIWVCEWLRAEQAAHSGYLAGVCECLQSYVVRFALIIHLCRWAEGQAVDPTMIDAASMQAAVRLAEWFLAEARRIYTLLVAAAADDADRRTLDLIRRKGGRITARELRQSVWRFRNDPAGARAELDRLAKSRGGHWEPSVGGRTDEFVPGQHAKGCDAAVDVDAQGFDEKQGRQNRQE